jgi:hypothetical protein
MGSLLPRCAKPIGFSHEIFASLRAHDHANCIGRAWRNDVLDRWLAQSSLPSQTPCARLSADPCDAGVDVDRAAQYPREIRGAVVPSNSSPANPDIHRRSTAEEQGDRSICRRHRRYDHRCRPGAQAASAIAWSLPSQRTAPFCPAASPGRTTSRGLARGFIPDVLDRSVLDEILTVGNQAAFDTARALARHLIRRRGRCRAQDRRA